jgi:polyhydroxyalkanoate synthesis regulator phasin
MRESVRKLGLIGVGLWAMTEEKIDEMVKDLVDKETISRGEGKKVIQDVLEESKKQKVDLERKISDKIQNAISKKDMFTRRDMHELQSRIKILEDEIQRMKNKEKIFFK